MVTDRELPVGGVSVAADATPGLRLAAGCRIHAARDPGDAGGRGRRGSAPAQGFRAGARAPRGRKGSARAQGWVGPPVPSRTGTGGRNRADFGLPRCSQGRGVSSGDSKSRDEPATRRDTPGTLAAAEIEECTDDIDQPRRHQPHRRVAEATALAARGGPQGAARREARAPPPKAPKPLADVRFRTFSPFRVPRYCLCYRPVA